ncbi:hypothetical protein DICSQDRAFT_180607 [Dichomitus squalens LYAD-421 SS1]|uniref:Uncharacterized protein n=1 Tax=Dichomitus squalens (strain LYAD-421) TaxID=732165 RepID=R7T051_DICSQ|nr:uncharacterized protein DICSQDRAFT_180607 [Dichomitus squalens LYAD-421 SS1]EJF61593.1 hypothetical protein DICSQDRAFT_180607 [Dichomitus squalens LYAD-421 SS1]
MDIDFGFEQSNISASDVYNALPNDALFSYSSIDSLLAEFDVYTHGSQDGVSHATHESSVDYLPLPVDGFPVDFFLNDLARGGGTSVFSSANSSMEPVLTSDLDSSQTPPTATGNLGACGTTNIQREDAGDAAPEEIWPPYEFLFPGFSPEEDEEVVPPFVQMRCQWGDCTEYHRIDKMWSDHISKDGGPHRRDLYASKDRDKVKCLWDHCTTVAKLGSLKKHIEDCHLNLRRLSCVYCGYEARKDAYSRMHGFARDCRHNPRVKEAHQRLIFSFAPAPLDPSTPLPTIGHMASGSQSSRCLTSTSQSVRYTPYPQASTDASSTARSRKASRRDRRKRVVTPPTFIPVIPEYQEFLRSAGASYSSGDFQGSRSSSLGTHMVVPAQSPRNLPAATHHSTVSAPVALSQPSELSAMPMHGAVYGDVGALDGQAALDAMFREAFPEPPTTASEAPATSDDLSWIDNILNGSGWNV